MVPFCSMVQANCGHAIRDNSGEMAGVDDKTNLRMNWQGRGQGILPSGEQWSPEGTGFHRSEVMRCVCI